MPFYLFIIAFVLLVPLPGNAETIDRRTSTNTISNGRLRLDFLRNFDGYDSARVFVRQNKEWVDVGVWKPLFKIGDRTIQPLTARSLNKSSIEFLESQVMLRVTLDRERPLARIHYEWRSDKPQQFWGPNVYVGEGTTGAAKSWGLFPGLEYLYGPERSSNPRDFAPPLDDRRTPPPHQITIPLMAVTVGKRLARGDARPTNSSQFFTPDSLVDRSAPYDEGPQYTVALHWPAGTALTRLASPNFDEGMDNHRLGLFVTNASSLDATLVVSEGPVLVAVREWLRDNGGLPKANPWPRSFQSELDVCRTGFLKTVSDEKGDKFRHCIGWGASHAPGFAALLWLDSRIAKNAESAARVERVSTNMLGEGNAGALTSQANCHIMQWEFPFIYGHLAEAMSQLDGFVTGLVKSQRPDGGWAYEAGTKEQADLGRAGDSVLGTCANRASSLLRYARVTGDRAAFEAGEKALHFMEMFRVPRGGQTWECPMYEPDILAAAYAVRAYHDGYRVSADKRWLRNAVYWAETGVPFIYLWSLPNKPMMLGATIPVFGSTFYKHSWLGVPVQWCGLVYAYHVFHLAEELKKAREDARPPGVLGFSADDWERVTELITASATHQQFAEGEKIGAYPDSITNFERRNPAFINPEDILVNVLALNGYDPDIKTARVKSKGGEVVISSAAKIEKARANAFELEWFQDELSHTLFKGAKPHAIRVDGAALAQSEQPVRREPGWWWDEKYQRAYITARHSKPKMRIEVN